MELQGLKFYKERSEIEFKDERVIITKKEGILLEYLMKNILKL